MRYLNLNVSKSKKPRKFFQYLITDTIYQSDVEIMELEHLLQIPFICGHINSTISAVSFSKCIYDQAVLIGENMYALQVYTNNINYYQLIHKNYNYIIDDKHVTSNCKVMDITLLMGPVMILNLVLNNTYCLHASSFSLKDTVFVLMADSGTGKSTIARFMDTQVNSNRIADDITPIKYMNDKLTILPHFAQLKLDKKQQYQGTNPNKKIVFLFAEISEENTCINKINGTNCIKKLINHTVATKLFNHYDLKKHLNFCFQATQLTPCYTLKYQHSSNSLLNLYQQLYDIC